HPTIALSERSTATIFVQTSSGRDRYDQPIEQPFDVRVPGTIKLTGTPGRSGEISMASGYADVVVRGGDRSGSALDDGRFTFVIPFELGTTPEHSMIDVAPTEGQPTPLAVKGTDTVYVGYRYETESGSTAWQVSTINLGSDMFFHVMDRHYREPLEAIHVGERLYVRLIRRELDVTDEKDAAEVTLTAQSGQRYDGQLLETFGHSGIFKGIVQLAYAEEEGAGDAPNVLPVEYGDRVTVRYAPAAAEPMEWQVAIHKGSDGEALPFTKRFKDPELAVQTQFTIAEAYFEQAKRHRDLGNESLARREIAQGKKLLMEAIRDYPETDLKAQANYLLAELAFEYGKDAENETIQRRQFVEAITRFSDIVASYPDSSYAPRAQYKKALVLETMAETGVEPGAIDRAMEEYVKLSYKYPGNELVAETIARLGNYFLSKGKALEAEAEAAEDLVQQEKIRTRARDMYTTAGEVLARLSERFPDHQLAGKTLVLSGKAFLQGRSFEKALKSLKKVYEQAHPDPDLAPVAMYWAADTYFQQEEMEMAYRLFTRIRWDYPEHLYAKYARGRLAEPGMIEIAEKEASN
ncbi:MAG: tetratricopeptide repeat protein, partial [Phycisphaeraceae bacterium]|nr:tetratricopeptide repeat protein [Phycisphaeraceae bacterium]